jgi:hypothetical protein
MGQVETLKESGSRGLGLRVFLGTKSASSSTSDLTPDGIRQLVDGAIALAKFTEEDPFTGLPEASEFGSLPNDLHLYYDDVYSLYPAPSASSGPAAAKPLLSPPIPASPTPMAAASTPPPAARSWPTPAASCRQLSHQLRRRLRRPASHGCQRPHAARRLVVLGPSSRRSRVPRSPSEKKPPAAPSAASALAKFPPSASPSSSRQRWPAPLSAPFLKPLPATPSGVTPPSSPANLGHKSPPPPSPSSTTTSCSSPPAPAASAAPLRR